MPTARVGDDKLQRRAAAKTRIDEATTEYQHLRDTAKERKTNIQAKIDALKA